MIVDVVGYVGGSIASSSMVIQLIKSYRKQSVIDFSWIMLCLNSSGCLLIVIYGFLIERPAIYITTLVSLFSFVVIIVMKIYFEHYKKMNLPPQQMQPSLNTCPV